MAGTMQSALWRPAVWTCRCLYTSTRPNAQAHIAGLTWHRPSVVGKRDPPPQTRARAHMHIHTHAHAHTASPMQVVFRPLKMQHYNDDVEIVANGSSFLVPVHAYTPATHIEVHGHMHARDARQGRQQQHHHHACRISVAMLAALCD